MKQFDFLQQNYIVHHSIEKKHPRVLSKNLCTVKLGDKELFGHPKIVP